jgi:hypothetical protein
MKRETKKPQDRLMSFNIHVILAQIELHAGGMHALVTCTKRIVSYGLVTLT